jgi:hypothetical protein
MLKRTTAEVAEYFKLKGCKLLGEYLGAQVKMEYICSCGNKGSASWNNFSNGKRCGKCQKWGLAHKKTLDEIKKIFLDKGCQFLDDWYGGIHQLHNYTCKCKRISIISFAGFYYQNQYCKECGIEKNRGSNNHSWIPDREKLKQDKLFRKKMYKALRSTLLNFGKEKVGRTSDMLGYGPQSLKEHIESHPNWINCKDANWHLDHIFPIQAFLDFNIYKPEIINCLENLQPLEGKENISKHARYDPEDFKEWLKTKGIDIDIQIAT